MLSLIKRSLARAGSAALVAVALLSAGGEARAAELATLSLNDETMVRILAQSSLAEVDVRTLVAGRLIALYMRTDVTVSSNVIHRFSVHDAGGDGRAARLQGLRIPVSNIIGGLTTQTLTAFDYRLISAAETTTEARVSRDMRLEFNGDDTALVIDLQPPLVIEDGGEATYGIEGIYRDTSVRVPHGGSFDLFFDSQSADFTADGSGLRFIETAGGYQVSISVDVDRFRIEAVETVGVADADGVYRIGETLRLRGQWQDKHGNVSPNANQAGDGALVRAVITRVGATTAVAIARAHQLRSTHIDFRAEELTPFIAALRALGDDADGSQWRIVAHYTDAIGGGEVASNRAPFEVDADRRPARLRIASRSVIHAGGRGDEFRISAHLRVTIIDNFGDEIDWPDSFAVYNWRLQRNGNFVEEGARNHMPTEEFSQTFTLGIGDVSTLSVTINLRQTGTNEVLVSAEAVVPLRSLGPRRAVELFLDGEREPRLSLSQTALRQALTTTLTLGATDQYGDAFVVQPATLQIDTSLSGAATVVARALADADGAALVVTVTSGEDVEVVVGVSAAAATPATLTLTVDALEIDLLFNGETDLRLSARQTQLRGAVVVRLSVTAVDENDAALSVADLSVVSSATAGASLQLSYQTAPDGLSGTLTATITPVDDADTVVELRAELPNRFTSVARIAVDAIDRAPALVFLNRLGGNLLIQQRPEDVLVARWRLNIIDNYFADDRLTTTATLNAWISAGTATLTYEPVISVPPEGADVEISVAPVPGIGLSNSAVLRLTLALPGLEPIFEQRNIIAAEQPVLLLDGVAQRMLSLRQAAKGETLSMDIQLTAVNSQGVAVDIARRAEVTATATAGAAVKLSRVNAPDGLSATLTLTITPDKDADTVVVLRATLGAAVAETIIEVDAVDRVPLLVLFSPLGERILEQNRPEDAVVARWRLSIIDNYGVTDRLATTATLNASISAGTATLTYEPVISVPPGGADVEISVAPVPGIGLIDSAVLRLTLALPDLDLVFEQRSIIVAPPRALEALLLNGEAALTLAQTRARQPVTATLTMSGADQYGDAFAIADAAASLSTPTNGASGALLMREDSADGLSATLTLTITPFEDMDTMVALRVAVGEFSVTATIAVDAVDRAPASLVVTAAAEVFAQPAPDTPAVARFALRVIDNYGDDDALPATTVTLSAAAADASTPTLPSEFSVPPGGGEVAVSLTPTTDTRLIVTASLAGVEEASAEARIEAAPAAALTALLLNGEAAPTLRLAAMRPGEPGTLTLTLGGLDQYGDAFAVGAVRIQSTATGAVAQITRDGDLLTVVITLNDSGGGEIALRVSDAFNDDVVAAQATIIVLPNGLLFNDENDLRLSAPQTQLRGAVMGSLIVSAADENGAALSVVDLSAQSAATAGALVELSYLTAPAGIWGILTFTITLVEDADTVVVLRAMLGGLVATATIAVDAVDRAPASLEVTAGADVFAPPMPGAPVAARFALRVIDNYGDDDALPAATVTLSAAAVAASTPNLPSEFSVPPGGGEVAVSLTPMVETTLVLTARLAGVEDASAAVRIRTVPIGLLFNGENDLRLSAPQTQLRGAVVGRLIVTAVDENGAALSVVDLSAVSVVTPDALLQLSYRTAPDGLSATLTFTTVPVEDADTVVELRAMLGGLVATATIAVDAVDRVPVRLELRAVSSDTLTQSEFGEAVTARFALRVIDNYGDDDRLPTQVVTLRAASDDGSAPTLPAVFEVPPSGGEVAVSLTPTTDTTLIVTASLAGVEDASAEARVLATAPGVLTALLLNGEAMPMLEFDLSARDVVWTLRALDQDGNAFPITGVEVTTTVIADARLLSSLNVSLDRRDAADGLSATLTLAFAVAVRGNDVQVRLVAAAADVSAVATMDFLASPVVVGFLPTEYTVSESGGSQTVCVAVLSGHLSRYADAPNPEITFQTGPGTARSGDDYNSLSQTLRFSGDTIERCVDIAIVDDDIVEDTETFFASISFGGWQPPNPRDRHLTTNPDLAVIRILDDDATYDMSFYDVSEVLASVAVGTIPTDDPRISSIARGSDLAASTATLSFIEGELGIYEFWALSDGGTRPESVVRVELTGAGAAAYQISVGPLSDGGSPLIPSEPSLSSVDVTLSASMTSGDLLKIRALTDSDTGEPQAATLRISHVSGNAIDNLPLEFALSTRERAVVNVETYLSRAWRTPLELIEDNDAKGFLRISLHGADDESFAYYDRAGGMGTLSLGFSTSGNEAIVSSLCPADLTDFSGSGVDICVRSITPPFASLNYTLSATGSTLNVTYQRNGQREFWLEVVAPEDGREEGLTKVSFSLGRPAMAGFSRGSHREGVITVIDADVTYDMEFYDVTEVFAPAPVGINPINHPGIGLQYSYGPDFADAGALVFNEGELRTYEFFGYDGSGKPRESVVRIELLGEGAFAYRFSVDNFTIPPEPSLMSSVTFSLSSRSDVGDILRIRSLADGDGAAPPPATLRISRVSGELIDNLPLEFALSTLEPVQVNVETFASRSAAHSAPLELLEGEDALGFLRVSLTRQGNIGYSDGGGGVATLTLSFESQFNEGEYGMRYGMFGLGLLCRDDLSYYLNFLVELCIRPVADANYTLSAEGGTLTLTYRREGHGVFWLEVLSPPDFPDAVQAPEPVNPIYFSLADIDIDAGNFVKGRHEGVITLFDNRPLLKELRIEGGDNLAWARTLTLTLGLSGFDQFGAALDIRNLIDEVSATSTFGAKLISYGTTAVDVDGTQVTLTLTVAATVPEAGAAMTIIVRAGDAHRVEPLEERKEINIGVKPYIWGFRDITALNQGLNTHDVVTRGSGPPLADGAVVEFPAGGEALLEFYAVQVGFQGQAKFLYWGMGFEGTQATVGYRFRRADGDPPRYPDVPPSPHPHRDNISFEHNDLIYVNGITLPEIIRIGAPITTTAAAVFRARAFAHLPGNPSQRSSWPPHNMPVSVTLRALPPPEDIEVYPVASAAISTPVELTAHHDAVLATNATADDPAVIAAFAIEDAGSDGLNAPLKFLRVDLKPAVGGGSVDDLETTLQAFTFRLRHYDLPGVAPDIARINETLNLVRSGDTLRLEKEFYAEIPGSPRRTPQPIVPDGGTVRYEIVAYHNGDTETRIADGAEFRLRFADDSFAFAGGSELERIDTDYGFNAEIDVVASQFQLSQVRTVDLYPGAYVIDGADWPTLRFNGGFTDAFGNTDTGVSLDSVVGVIQRVGQSVTMVVTPTTIAADHLDFDAAALADFTAALTALGGGADSADGSRWVAGVRYKGAAANTTRVFIVTVPGPAFAINSLKLARQLEHDTASRLEVSGLSGGAGINLANLEITAACFTKDPSLEPNFCGELEVADASMTFSVTPLLKPDYSMRYGSSLVLTFHYTTAGVTPIPSVGRQTIRAEELSADSAVRNFDVLPIPIEAFFRQREYLVGEDVVNADLSIASNPKSGRRNTPVTLPMMWRVRVEFGEAMTGYADWPVSITRGGTFVEENFGSVRTQLLIPVPITDDTTYKPRETMEARIASVHFTDDGSPARFNSDPGHAVATIIVRDLDTVDVNAELYENRDDDDPSASVEFFEGNAAGAYLRLYLTETDGGADYYDAAGGAGTITLTFSGESTLCPSNLDDLSGTAFDLCARPVRNANYTLAAGDSTGTVHLSYTRDGKHEFWVEVVAPIDGVEEGVSTITFTIANIDIGGDAAFVEGAVAGSVVIFDMAAEPAVPFVLDYDQSGNVNISDGLILGRLMAGVIAFETNLGPNFNRFFAENAPPGTLVADSMLLNVISEDATADAAKLLSDRTLRDEALQSVLFIYFNYSDDLDLDKSGNLNISDGLILGRLVAGVIAAEVSFGPGFPNFFNPDGSLNKGLDPGTLDLFYVDVEADATGILPNEAVRREAIEKVLEIYVRAGFSFTD